MIELPNEKVLRNLPEQVAKNVADIAKLFELIAQVPIAVNFYTKQETNEKFVAEVTDLDSTLISLYNKFGSNAFIVKGADTAYLFFLWPNEGEFNIGYRDLITGEIVTGSDYSETSTLDDVISNAGNTILAIDNYNAAKTYNIGNAVYYQDKLYVCVMPNTSGTLPTDTSKWVTLNGLYIIELQPSVTSGNLNTTSLSKLNNFDVVLYKDGRYYYKEANNSGTEFRFVSYYSYVSGSYGGRFLEVKSINVTISSGSWVLYDVDYPMLPLRDANTQVGGQRLKLNNNLMPEWADPELPSAAAASAGDILVLNADKDPVWGGNVPNVEEAESGTAVNILGLNADGNVIKELSYNKPIYVHPIIIQTAGTFKIGLFIFNNSPTPFTASTLADYIEDLYEAAGDTVRIVATGGFKASDSSICIASNIGKTSTNYYMTGISVTTATELSRNYSSKELLIAAISSISDSVYRIN